jgi:hypothetical protein
MTENEQYYYDKILEFYPKALLDFKESGTQTINLSYQRLDEVHRYTPLIKINKEEYHIYAYLHAIECVICDDSFTKRDENITDALNNKKLEALKLLIDNGILPEDFRNYTFFRVIFIFKITCSYSGTMVTQLRELNPVLSALYGLRYTLKMWDSMWTRVVPKILIDSMKLYIQALISAHPNLEIWRNINKSLIPINETEYPVHVRKAHTKDKINKDNKKETPYEEREKILKQKAETSNQYKELLAKGYTKEEIKEHFKPVIN